MNVNELIEFERAKYGDEHINRIFELGFEFRKMKNKAMVLWDDDLTEVIEDLFSGELQTHKKNSTTIEYSRKVKVPQFIADWLEQCKGFDESCQAYDQDNAITLQNAIDVDTGGITKDIVEWLWHVGNDELFARAWLDGYEVEEEPKWVVKNNKGKYFCTMGFSTNQNEISNVIWQREKKFEFKTKEAAEAVILLVGGTVEKEGTK